MAEVIGYCPLCTAPVEAGHGAVCISCYEKLPPDAELAQSADQARSAITQAPLKNRYADAYRVGRTIDSFGTAIKFAGFTIAGLILVVSLSNMRPASPLGPFGPQPALLNAAVLGGVIVAVLVAAVGFVLGVLVSAQGQILLATLDSAVNNSHFLTLSEKAAILGVPSTAGVPAAT